MRAKLFWMLGALGLLGGCVRQSSSDGGGAGGAGGGGQGGAGLACIDQLDEAACLASPECTWRNGMLFAGPPYDCAAPQAVKVCTGRGGGGFFDTEQHWRRDVAGARIILELGAGEVMPGDETCGVNCSGTYLCPVCPCLQ